MELSAINTANIAGLYQAAKDIGLIILYQGKMSQQKLIEIGNVLRSNLQDNSVSAQIIKRIFAIFIEEAQNILKYSAERDEEEDGYSVGKGIMIISHEDEHFSLYSGNYIQASAKDNMETVLEKVSKLSKEELTAALKELKRNKTMEHEDDSAGLGFYDMAKKSDNPLEWAFQDDPDNPERLFFTLKVTIKNK